MRVGVLGAGVAGAAAALTLAQEGHDVVVLDHDPPPPAGDADEVFQRWAAPGVAQHRQPHNFLGLGRAVLRDRLPEVYAALMASGATEVDQATFLGDAPRVAGDDDLATVACRRPVFDAVLRRAALEVADVRQAEVTGLDVRSGHVTGLTVSGGRVTVDLLVDASGRASKVPGWLAEHGHPQPPPLQTDCGLLYYSRHYRLRDGEVVPPYASVLGGPRGDVGYLAFAVFLGDSRTFSLVVMTPTWDKQWRELRDADAFDRVARLLPGMAPWLEVADPITGVLPMGHLRNVLRAPYDVPGLVAIGDALFHTNPTFAFGASLSLAHGALLSDLTRKARDEIELVRAFEAEVEVDLRSRHAAVSAEDRDRVRAWSGEPLDVTDRTSTMPLYLRSVVYRVAARDPFLLRAVARRVDALDPVELLESDEVLLARADELYDELRGSIPPPPPKESLLSALGG
jgi:2-polyprenyl-6-methoxyphenol hydroxylase-like FAD-dependent oxidoreductase